MSSLLIHGGTKEARKKRALLVVKEKDIDSKHVKIIDQKKLGIDVIKEMITSAHIRARGGGGKAVIIIEAQRMTEPAQNALLKTLEEPPGRLTIILTVPSPKLLLSTIVSRCMVIKAQKKTETQKDGSHLRGGPFDSAQGKPGSLEGDKFIKKLLTAAPGRRIAMFEDEIGYDKDDVLEFFDEVEAYLQKNLLEEEPTGKTLRVKEIPTRRVEECGVELSKKLRHLWRSKKILREDTANVKLAVDEWLLSW